MKVAHALNATTAESTKGGVVRLPDDRPVTGRERRRFRVSPRLGEHLATARDWQCAAAMRKQALIELLTRIHQSVDRVTEDLDRDQPELASALRRESRWIPRPCDVLRPPEPRNVGLACESLRPLLYDALSEGLVDARQFDTLMLRRARAARILGTREA